MSPTQQIVLQFLIAIVIGAAFASNKTSIGCNLKKTNAIKKHMDPEAEPLETNITIIINCVRDVPDSGGSIATDFA